MIRRCRRLKRVPLGRGYKTTPHEWGSHITPASPIHGALYDSPAALALGGRGSRQGRASWLTIIAIATVLLAFPGIAWAHGDMPHNVDVFSLVGFDQRLNQEIPLGLNFRDENNQVVELGSFVHDKPVILALSYFECATLCPLVRQGLIAALQPLSFSVGEQFDVILVSIDPDETPADASEVKAATMAEYNRPGSEDGWHFLTGQHENIDQLAAAIGFRFAYDGAKDEYAHPSGLVLLTPSGTIARYFFGIEYETRDLRLGLVEASHNQIGTPVDQLLLLCYHYEPAVGKYSLLIMNVVRLAALVTVGGLAMLIFVMWRKETHRAPSLG